MIKTGALLAQDTTVVTDVGSGLDIYFSDGSIMTVDPNSILTLSNLTVAQNDKDTLITKIKVLLTQGKIWNKVVRLAEKSTFDVESTSAIAGVRGTEFGAELLGHTEAITVLSGKVELTPKGRGTTTVTPLQVMSGIMGKNWRKVFSFLQLKNGLPRQT